MKISVCIIVKNEEKYIKQCIESIYDLAYEIIILDTGSTDKTKEITQEFDKVKLFETTWKDDFSIARNECISYASGDWILSIDADEIFSSSYDELISSINQYDLNTIFRFKVISLLGENREFLHFRDSLFPNNKNITFFRPIHEQLSFSEMNIIKLDNIVITHFGELEDTKKLHEKKLKYIAKMEKLLETASDLDKMHYFRHLGDTYSNLNKNTIALEKYVQSYNLLIINGFYGSEDCMYVLHGILSHLLLDKKEIDYKLIEHANKFDWVYLQYLLGLYHSSKKEYKKSKDIFNKLLKKITEKKFISKILLELGKIELKASNHRALNYLLESEVYLPSNLETIVEIMKIYVRENDLTKAIEYFLKLNPNSNFKDELLLLLKENKNSKAYKKGINDLEEFLLKLES